MSTACGAKRTPGIAESTDGAAELPQELVARGAAERYVGSLLAQCRSIASVFESSAFGQESAGSEPASPQSPTATHFAFCALEGEDAPIDPTTMLESKQPTAALMPDLMSKQTVTRLSAATPAALPSNAELTNVPSIVPVPPSSPQRCVRPSPFNEARNSETMRLKRLMDQSPRKRRVRPTSAGSRLHAVAPTEGMSVPSRPRSSSRRWRHPEQEYPKSVGGQAMLQVTWGAPGPALASAASFHRAAALSRGQRLRPCSSLGARGVSGGGGPDEVAAEGRTRGGVGITCPRSAICAPEHPNPLRGLSATAASVGSRSPGGTRATADGAKSGSGLSPSTLPASVGSGSRPSSSRPHTRTREARVLPVSCGHARRRTCKIKETHVELCASQEGSGGAHTPAETDARPTEVLNTRKSYRHTPKSELEMAFVSAFDDVRRQGRAVLNEAQDATGCWDLHCIARDQRMHIDDVLLVKSVFDSLDHDGSGTLDLAEFETAVLRLLDLQLKDSSHVPADRVKSISEWCWWNSDRNCDGSIDFQEFIKWYSSNGFSEDLLLTDEERRLRQIARQHGVQTDFVEQVKRCFDSFDKDSSGEVDRPEFGQLLNKLLKVPPNYELPPSRVQYFWAQVDTDNSGKAVFEEFLQWYIKNFGDTSGSDEPRKRMPFEDFYSQVRRIRRRQLDPPIPRERPLLSS